MWRGERTSRRATLGAEAPAGGGGAAAVDVRPDVAPVTAPAVLTTVGAMAWRGATASGFGAPAAAGGGASLQMPHDLRQLLVIKLGFRWHSPLLAHPGHLAGSRSRHGSIPGQGFARGPRERYAAWISDESRLTSCERGRMLPGAAPA